VVATSLLLDVDAAFGTLLCAHGLDGLLRLLVFHLPGAVARARVPWTIARETELVVAVWAYCSSLFGAVVLLGLRLALVLAIAIAGVGLVLATTALRGEVGATIRVEANNVRWISSEEVLCDCCIPTVICVSVASRESLARQKYWEISFRVEPKIPALCNFQTSSN
jgi:hypothetical protein